MKRPAKFPTKLAVLAAAALALTAGSALAQPPGRGAGPFGLLQNDANGDGRLTRAEFDAAQTARFNAVDTNKDGKATAEEFKAVREARASERRADMAAARFKALDADSNGQVSQSEFAAAAGKADDQRARGFRAGHGGDRHGPMKAWDRRGGADKDGAVTQAEFNARGLEAFGRADANKDGTVTIAELQAMAPGRR